ncbi:MAG: hypothetical protein Q4G44_04470 [Alcaligenaceae bacterium]|nr:hypothetical protein [Alcaligenaceae bacterium]
MIESGYVKLSTLNDSAIGNTCHPPCLNSDPSPELVPGDGAIIVAMKKVSDFEGVIIRPEAEGGVGINMNHTKVVNLGSGTDGTDVIKLKQLNQAIAKLQIDKEGNAMTSWNLSAVDGVVSQVNCNNTVNLCGDENIIVT